jgi:transketolase
MMSAWQNSNAACAATCPANSSRDHRLQEEAGRRPADRRHPQGVGNGAGSDQRRGAGNLGGSADLTGSNNTRTSQTKAITPDDFSGRYIHYGIREHGMAAIMNGMALHGGLIPYSGGFLIFSDYCRPSIRLAALMGISASSTF